jgi:hypothetical protein
MSDASHPHCRKCRQPDYACDCDDPDYVEPVVSLIMRGKPVPVDHPFLVERRRKRCIECGTNYADPPSRLCPGCEAYREHQR